MLLKELAAKQKRFEENFNSYKVPLCFSGIRQRLIYTYCLCFNAAAITKSHALEQFGN